MIVRSMFVTAGLVVAMASLVGCDEKKKDEGTGTAGATEKAAVALSDEDLAVAADYAEEAEGEISGDNYKDKLADIEKDIDKE